MRLWVVLAIPPNGTDLLVTAAILLAYCLTTAPLGLRWNLVDLEPLQVWWNLQLYRYKFRLYNNRQAAKLMGLLGGWVAIEELVLRVSLVPLLFEQMPSRQRFAWLVLAWAIAIIRYIFLYCRFHPFLSQLRLLVLAALLDLACLMTYVVTESFWLTILCHWLVLTVWLLLLGGLYQLRQYKVLQLENRKF